MTWNDTIDVDTRHFLTDVLREVGGHIGYCISPLYRKKEYGKEIDRSSEHIHFWIYE